MFGTMQALKVYQSTKALGEIAIASEYTMVIDGLEDMTYLIKQFPIPVVTPEDTIEVPMIGGIKTYTPQAIRCDFRGSIAFKETVDGKVRKLIEGMQANIHVGVRPKFNATLYLGTPDEFTQKWRLIDATLFGFDPFDADNENRGQIVTLTGQIAYMYFAGVE